MGAGFFPVAVVHNTATGTATTATYFAHTVNLCEQTLFAMPERRMNFRQIAEKTFAILKILLDSHPRMLYNMRNEMNGGMLNGKL